MIGAADTAASMETVGDMDALTATRFSDPDLVGLQNFKLTRDLVCHLSFTSDNVKKIRQISLPRSRKRKYLYIFQCFRYSAHQAGGAAPGLNLNRVQSEMLTFAWVRRLVPPRPLAGRRFRSGGCAALGAHHARDSLFGKARKKTLDTGHRDREGEPPAGGRRTSGNDFGCMKAVEQRRRTEEDFVQAIGRKSIVFSQARTAPDRIRRMRAAFLPLTIRRRRWARRAAPAHRPRGYSTEAPALAGIKPSRIPSGTRRRAAPAR
ncbi:hypothetical protein BDD21_3160 [Thiocapsa rosea]|uniref:Uncharacterized protein n=1 Tax=Thiocapsa rosea TaxID=69360 RepID=A0A495VD00_9GAMM|nr:hypothetical protein BDD21_3160 [Thiocapsa rosea]